MLSDIRIRRAKPEDTAFITKAWAESYRRHPDNLRMPTSAFHGWNRPRMTRLLASNLVLVAEDEETPGFLYGFLCAGRGQETFALHYAYTKGAFWRQGIASMLLDSALNALDAHDMAKVFTHLGAWDEYLERKGYEYAQL